MFPSQHRETADWILGISVAVSLTGALLLHFASGADFFQEPVHSSMEAAGSLIALFLAGILYLRARNSRDYTHFIWISSALVAMGILDGFHACFPVGNGFVWTRSLATLVGGLLFAAVWLPIPEGSRGNPGRYLAVAAAVAIGLGTLTVFFPDVWPSSYAEQGGGLRWNFGVTAANVAGGIGFLAASAFFVVKFRAARDSQSLVFTGYSALLGVASLLFVTSELWNLEWWYWHALRLLAYVIVFRFALGLFQGAQRKERQSAEALRKLYAELEKRVEARTAELAAANLSLRLRSEELAQFAHVASHDLKEPLRMVTIYLELLEARYTGKLDAEADEFIHFAADGSKRMGQLIDALLIYSEQGRRPLENSVVELNEVIEEVLHTLGPAIAESGAVITRDDLPTLSACRDQLARLFQNLISNAIKFRGNEPPRIHVSALKSADEWVISVSDNGIGIEPRYLEQIFVMFQRLHSRRKFAGTGIGLAICKKIAERHGGRILVSSRPGKGSVFAVHLPVSSTYTSSVDLHSVG